MEVFEIEVPEAGEISAIARTETPDECQCMCACGIQSGTGHGAG